jgi:hypothetical protein
MRKLAIAPVVLLVLGGCESFGVCTDELTFRINQTHVTISVGESFTPLVSAETCGGTRDVAVNIRWSTADSTVAAIDAQTGRTTGRRPGLTVIEGVDQSRFGAGSLTVNVRVIE